MLDGPEFEARLDARPDGSRSGRRGGGGVGGRGTSRCRGRARSMRARARPGKRSISGRRSPAGGSCGAPSPGESAPPRVALPTLEVERERLSGWSGTPLDRKNLGAFLPEQTHVATIAPTERWQAVLVMDQTEREELLVDRPVRLKLEELPQPGPRRADRGESPIGIWSSPREDSPTATADRW